MKRQNEYSLPSLLKVEPTTHATMARTSGELRRKLRVPFGVNVLFVRIGAHGGVETSIETLKHRLYLERSRETAGKVEKFMDTVRRACSRAAG